MSLPPSGAFWRTGRSWAAPTVLTRFEWLFAEHAGMFIRTTGSLFGDTLETVVASVNGRVLFLTTNPAVLENGLLMGIGVANSL